MNLQYALLVRITNAWEFALCVLLFAFIFQKRSRFFLRLLAGFGLYTAVAAWTAVLQTWSNGFWMRMLITVFVYTGTAQWVNACWKMSLANQALCLCAGTAVQALTGRVTELFYLVLGGDSYRSINHLAGYDLSNGAAWLIYALVHFGVIFALAFAFRGKNGASSNQRYSRIDILYSISVMLFTSVLQNYSRPLEADNPEMAGIVRTLVMTWSLLVLIFRSMLLAHGRVNEELEITQRLLNMERKQFEAIKDDMEMINIKCHDMRHMLDQYTDRLTEAEMKELRGAIRIYDSHLKTGNDILNMVLYKKQAIMEQRHITLSCMADARCLSFMEASDVFSMMNNAMDNAIEAVSRLKDEAMRLISLQVRPENGVAVIQVTNYFVPGNVGEDSLPQTSKEDFLKHGYGMRSIEYVAQKYDGLMRFQTEDNLFHLNICIPIAEKE